MLNVFQLMMSLSVDWLTVTVEVPSPLTVPAPPTMLGPCGPAKTLLATANRKIGAASNRLKKPDVAPTSRAPRAESWPTHSRLYTPPYLATSAIAYPQPSFA